MVNPGSFHGARKAFLLAQKAQYADAVQDHHTAETISLILRAFFKRFPIHLPDDYEPSEEELARVDDNAPDPELTDLGSADESDASSNNEAQPQQRKKKKKKAKQGSKSRKNRIAFRRVQIKRWMAYQYAKDNSAKEKENGAFNPYKIFLPRFVPGLKTPEPRRKPAFNLWRKTKRTEINDISKTQVETSKQSGNPIPSSHFATRRESIARSLYNALSKDKRDHWETVADEQHELAKTQHELEQQEEISKDPADCQRAIQLLTSFIKPILALICDVTGWKCTFIAGGPEPAADGQFSLISVHSGTTSGPVPLNFGSAERAFHKKQLIPAFGRFLRLCYDRDECRARALNPQEGFMSMSDAMQDDADVDAEVSTFDHAVEKASPSIQASVHEWSTSSPNQDRLEGAEEQTVHVPHSQEARPLEIDDMHNDNPFPLKIQSPGASPAPSPAPSSSPSLGPSIIDPALINVRDQPPIPSAFQTSIVPAVPPPTTISLQLAASNIPVPSTASVPSNSGSAAVSASAVLSSPTPAASLSLPTAVSASAIPSSTTTASSLSLPTAAAPITPHSHSTTSSAVTPTHPAATVPPRAGLKIFIPSRKKVADSNGTMGNRSRSDKTTTEAVRSHKKLRKRKGGDDEGTVAKDGSGSGETMTETGVAGRSKRPRYKSAKVLAMEGS